MRVSALLSALLTCLCMTAHAATVQITPMPASAPTEATAAETTVATAATEATATDLAPTVLVNRIADPTLAWPFADDQPVCEVWIPRIHDADAAVIRCGGETVVIDTGDLYQADAFVSMMRRIGVDRVKAVYNSHPHHDHLDGIGKIADVFPVDALYIGFHEYYNATMRRAMVATALRGVPVEHCDDGDVFRVGDAVLTTFMKGDPGWDLNNQSVVMRLKYGDRTMLFTGDIGPMGEGRIAETVPAEELRSDLLKYPHHGLQPMNDAFVKAVNPVYTIITNTQRVFKTRYDLNLRKIPFHFTITGVTHIATDGKIWAMERLQEEEIPQSGTTPAPTPIRTPPPLPAVFGVADEAADEGA